MGREDLVLSRQSASKILLFHSSAIGSYWCGINPCKDLTDWCSICRREILFTERVQPLVLTSGLLFSNLTLEQVFYDTLIISIMQKNNNSIIYIT